MSDHEYITPGCHDATWPGDWKERAETLEAEANNLAEALRQVNARLVKVFAERDAAKRELQRVASTALEYARELHKYWEFWIYQHQLEALITHIAELKRIVQPEDDGQ